MPPAAESNHSFELLQSATALGSRTRNAVRRAQRTLGGSIGAETVLVLALVLALDSADRASLGVLAPSIKAQFAVSNTQIGMLAAAFSVVGGLATVPVGVLTDRVHRVRLLALSIVIWSAAMVATGFAVTFLMLFVARLFLGVVTATAGPTVASLTGDLFPPSDRGRALSWIRTGDLVGSGIGFVLAGVAAALFGWRAVFFVLAAAGIAVAFRAHRLPEPERGSQGGAGGATCVSDESRTGDIAGRLVHEAHVAPNESEVIRDDCSDRSLWWAVKYVLRVRTNVIVMVGASIGNFFFAGLQLFAVEFVMRQFHIPKFTAAALIPVVGIGALAGILAAGRITDRLLAGGHLTARIGVSAWSSIIGGLVLVPAFLTHSLLLAVPLFVVGGACLAAPDPPLDAARLDVIAPQLWGRAEGVRTLFRIGAQAVAPLVFGLLSDHLGGGHAGDGLQLAFLIMTPMLLANGAVLLLARRTYPRDVASAQVSARAFAPPAEGR